MTTWRLQYNANGATTAVKQATVTTMSQLGIRSDVTPAVFLLHLSHRKR